MPDVDIRIGVLQIAREHRLKPSGGYNNWSRVFYLPQTGLPPEDPYWASVPLGLRQTNWGIYS